MASTTQTAKFEECGCCGELHREGATWAGGDCRNDDERFIYADMLDEAETAKLQDGELWSDRGDTFISCATLARVTQES